MRILQHYSTGNLLKVKQELSSWTLGAQQMCARIMAVSVFGSKEHYTKCLRTEPYVWVSWQRIEVNFKAAIISVFRATLLLMCLWGPTALGNSYWLLIVWQQPTLFQSPSHSSPVLRRAVVAVARLVMAWPPWVGILRTPAALPTLLILSHPPPLLQPTTTTTKTHPLPKTPYSVTLLAKDRGLFPRCHGDAAREKCKGREGRREGEEVQGERVQPSVLEPACLKTSRERGRERGRGGGICADTTPHGALCECVKVCRSVWERTIGNVWICEYVWEQDEQKRI